MTNIEEILKAQREFFDSDTTKSVEFRKQKLRLLKKIINENRQQILDALKADLGKSDFEGYACEVGLTLSELSHTISHIKKWAKPKRKSAPIVHFPSSAKIYYEPYGLTLIISPWNYPFLLSMEPIIGAIAAGNCVVFKPSAYSANTSRTLEFLLKKVFEPQHLCTVLGGREQNKELLSQKYDYIFFTGSTSVGKQVMESAAKNLTPVTLELGGKSPCIVDESANIDLAAKRIVWGKFLNAGQTCVAPDFVYVHKTQKEKLAAAMRKYIEKFYGAKPIHSPDYPKLINQKHFDRLSNLLNGQNIICGGESDANLMKISPTLVDSVNWDNPLMQEEIFGPVLPILPFDDISSVISLLKNKEKPLALYLFSNSCKNQNYIISSLSFGGGCINDTIVHLATSSIPFGGVGSSGIGQYHGKYSFETFSHIKGILKKSNKIDIFLRYPPYKKGRLGLLRKLLK